MEKLRNFDFITSPVELRVNNHKKLRNPLGAILSVISVIIVLALTVNLGYDMYAKKNPSLLIGSNFDLSKEVKAEITKDNFMFAFGLETTEGPVYLENMFYFSLEHVTYDTTSTDKIKLTSQEILYKMCSEEDIPPNIWGNFNLIRQFYCPQYSKLLFGGKWDQNINRYFILKVKHCSKNPVKSPNCISDYEKIKLTLEKQLFLSTVFQNLSVDAENSSNPLGIAPAYDYMLIGLNQFNKVYFYFREQMFYDDLAWIGSCFVVDNAIGFNRKDTSTSVTGKVGNIEERLFAESIVVLERDEETFYRSYLKIPTLIATVGGFNSIMIFIFRIVSKTFTRVYLPVSVARDLLSCSEEQDSVRIVDRTASSRIQLEGVLKPKVSNWKTSIRIIFCSKKERNFTRMYDKILKRLDIQEIIKWSFKVESFMHLLLNSHQYKALNLLDKVDINRDFMQVLENIENDPKKAREEVIEYIENRTKTGELSETDRLLLSNIK